MAAVSLTTNINRDNSTRRSALKINMSQRVILPLTSDCQQTLTPTVDVKPSAYLKQMTTSLSFCWTAVPSRQRMRALDGREVKGHDPEGLDKSPYNGVRARQRVDNGDKHLSHYIPAA